MGDQKYNSNIFELLGDDGKKKQQKKDAPKVDNKKKAAKAPVQAALPGDNRPQAKAPQQGKGNQNKGNQQAAQGRGNQGRGQNRGEGGRGRGEGRGRGRGRGRSEGRGRGGDGPFQADDNRQEGGNRGKSVSRRQRDDAFKRGDYGAPDAEGRQKRPYDKYSHSAGAKKKQEKKGGAGAGNWGANKGQVSEDAPPAEEEEKKETPENQEKNETPEGEEAGADEPVEESDEEIDYETFVERKKKEDEELANLVKTDVRKVDAAEFEGMKSLSKDKNDGEQLFAITGGKKKSKKSAKEGGNAVKVDQVLNVQAPREDKRGGKGRQNQRGNQRSQKRNVNLTLDDDNDFPSLGGK